MLPPIRPSPIIPNVRFIAFDSITARRRRSMVARWRDAHKGVPDTHDAVVLRPGCGGAGTGHLTGSCYNNRSMHHELDHLRCPQPGAGA